MSQTTADIDNDKVDENGNQLSDAEAEQRKTLKQLKWLIVVVTLIFGCAIIGLCCWFHKIVYTRDRYQCNLFDRSSQL